MSDKPKTISCHIFHNWHYKMTVSNIPIKCEQEEIRAASSKHLAAPPGELNILYKTAAHSPFSAKPVIVDYKDLK